MYFRNIILISLIGFTAANCSQNVSREDTTATPAFNEKDSKAAYDTVKVSVVSNERRVMGIQVHDFNSDGQLDVFPNGHDHYDKIFLKTADGFEGLDPLISEDAPDRHGCDVGDLNLDGLSDLICTQGAEAGAGEGLNEIFRGDGAGNFVRIDNHGAEEPTGRSRLFAIMNYDGDELPDIYTTVWHAKRLDTELNENTVLRNLGNFKFERVATNATGILGTKCLDTGDWNDDGFDDILICDHSMLGSKLLENTGQGDFMDVTSRLGLSGKDLFWTDALLADVDNNNHLDIVYSNSNALHIIYDFGTHGKGPLRKDRVIVGPYVGGIALSDLNRDGFSDIYVGKREFWNFDVNKNDVPDTVLFGPDWKEIMEIPSAETPTTDAFSYPPYGVVVAHAGHNFGGEIWLVQLD